jgi:chorismate mutase
MPLKKESIKIKDRNNNDINPLSLIRKKIDRIDNKIHDLIMSRAELVSDVVKEKRSENFKDIVIYRPAREHEILARLIKRHKGNISIISLISIWRNLISTYISIQGELKLIFTNNIDNIVNSHFTSEIKKIKKNNSTSCLKGLVENKAHIAILPFPNKNNDWWSKLNNFKGVNIVGSLSEGFYGETSALILSKQKIEYSSNNVALYTLKMNSKNTRAYSEFISSKGYNLICKKLLSNKKSIILFSIKVSSDKEINKKFKTIENFELEPNLKPKNIGVYSLLSKDILNG